MTIDDRQPPTILLTGARGQVGYELARELGTLGRVVACDRDQLDLTSAESIRTFVRHVAPQLIVNAAAYTAVDRAESEQELCRAINATAPAVLAEEAARLDAAIVHYSTDYVFDGAKARPYTERDEPNPVSVYGRTKLEGERAVAESGANFLIFRLCWVYGVRGHNFMRTMLRLSQERDELRVVADQFGTPTWSRAIASATGQALASGWRVGESLGEAVARRSGIYHMAARGRTSWHGFAEAILKLASSRGIGRTVPVRAIDTAGYPTAARRPFCSLLDTSLLVEQFGIRLPSWEAQLEQVMEDLVETEAGTRTMIMR